VICLGLETSCDETAAAVVEVADPRVGGAALAEPDRIRATIVASQVDLHQAFGGVVPEIACRAHVELIARVVERALGEAGVSLADLDAVATANRPGLIGALLIGLTAAKTLAWVADVPLVDVDHLHAHVYANVLAGGPVDFPAVALVVSGGHSTLFLIHDLVRLERLGGTTDDAAGEAFDKVASLLGLGYPGGPAIERCAREGSRTRYRLPRADLGPDRLDFSFSGVKTAVRYLLKGQNARTPAPPVISERVRADVAASFQEAVVDALVEKTIAAAERTGCETILLGGGVAANGRLREVMASAANAVGRSVRWPPVHLCTDNAAIVAGLACHRLLRGMTADLSIEARARAKE